MLVRVGHVLDWRLGQTVLRRSHSINTLDLWGPRTRPRIPRNLACIGKTDRKREADGSGRWESLPVHAKLVIMPDHGYLFHFFGICSMAVPPIFLVPRLSRSLRVPGEAIA